MLSGAKAKSAGETPCFKNALALALDEACALCHNYVGSEHILLGLVREQNGVAGQVLARVGIKPDDVRREVARLLNPQ